MTRPAKQTFVPSGIDQAQFPVFFARNGERNAGCLENRGDRELRSLGVKFSSRDAEYMAASSREEALRSLARSSELEANRLPTAELRIRDFLTPVGTNRAARRAALEELDNAVSREAELRPREASFRQAISDFIAQRLAMLNFD